MVLHKWRSAAIDVGVKFSGVDELLNWDSCHAHARDGLKNTVLQFSIEFLQFIVVQNSIKFSVAVAT